MEEYNQELFISLIVFKVRDIVTMSLTKFLCLKLKFYRYGTEKEH